MAPNERKHEQGCAESLVVLLVERHALPIRVLLVRVARDWKTEFSFEMADSYVGRRTDITKRRFGRRPGLEIDWERCHGDVDAWQIDGDVVSAAAHGWQILKRWLTGKEERPSKLLAAARRKERQNETVG